MTVSIIGGLTYGVQYSYRVILDIDLAIWHYFAINFSSTLEEVSHNLRSEVPRPLSSSLPDLSMRQLWFCPDGFNFLGIRKLNTWHGRT